MERQDAMPGTAEHETDGALLARLGVDAEKWAAEFCRVGWDEGGRQFLGELDPGPGGFLHVWLCNAIEAGRSAGYAQGAHDADYRTATALGLAPAEVARLAGAWYAVPDVKPANLAGSEAANLAGSPEVKPANLAGRPADPLERIAEALEALAACVSLHGDYWAAPHIRIDPAR